MNKKTGDFYNRPFAVGTAAAMTDDFTTLDISKLQTVLQKNGVVLHEKDL